ncbi:MULTISPECIES: hypothetical protein [Sphingomonas]|uniref:hypothetical protein n=1 Tax=Sphingomonas TaxID=13687 RepID=UPI00126A658F|nr:MULTISPECIES: hypothetical protein [Sphingomonas]
MLLLLKQRGGPCQHHELVTLLRASELVVRHSLADLVASGLVVIDEEEYALYAPASERLRDLVEGTQDLYARRPDSVRRQIVSANSRGLSAFADAFRLRKD